ncbi:v-akt murine thymoma viral oncogene-like 3 transcript variant 1 [Paraphysoderma sedebokerense]|nr:v-akt murine thymoma viral oncogene-like 3 transcript variant 1 [Paraphysoderma sedebokerense]
MKAQKEGWLQKQGNYIRNWRPRWFQLIDGILYYYKEPTVEPKPTNYFVLAGSKVIINEKMRANCFELILSNGDRRFMSASNKEERDEWIAALNTSISSRTRASLKPTQSQPETQSVFDSKAPVEMESSKATPFRIYRQMSPDDFEFHKVLGKGNYGKVLLATRKDDPKRKYYAVKVIKKSGLVDEDSIEHVLAENRVLQTLDHPFLVKLHYAFQTRDRLYFVMEYIRGGELFFHIVKEKRFPEERARLYIAEILCALHYLHSKGIVYRDLKLENLLLDDDGHIKITDFGLCKEGIGQDDTTSTFCGTPEYLAPEILEEEEYGKSVDWWALGIVMYEMLVGKPPFGSPESVEKLFQAIIHQQIVYPSILSQKAKSLLQALLDRDHLKRLGSGTGDGEEIMKHPFFEGIDWKKLSDRKIPMPFKPVIRSEGDVGNFDKEFTQLPAILTPTGSISHDLDKLDLEDFNFVSTDEKSSGIAK